MTETSPDTRPRRRRQCRNENADGLPCGAAPLIDSDKCWFHSRDNVAALSKGGIATRRARQGKTMAALMARLYGSAEAPECPFKPVPEEDVVKPSGMLFIECVDGRYKAVGHYDCDGNSHAEFVEVSPIDGYIHWLSDHPFALRQRALSLVGLRENTVFAGKRRWRYTDRAGDPVDEARVEEFLDVVVPDATGLRKERDPSSRPSSQ